MRPNAVILIGVSLFAVGFAHACVPPFTCETDEQCDAQPGGRCDPVTSHCVYDEDSSGPGTTAASLDPTTAGPGPGPDATTVDPATTDNPATDGPTTVDPATSQPVETDSNTTTAPDPTTEDPDTDSAETTTVDPTDPPDPPPCGILDDRLDMHSGKATGVAVAPDGTTYLAGVTSTAPTALRVAQILPDGSYGWVSPDIATSSTSADDDTDIWIRAFLDGGDLIVVYSARTSGGNNQIGPFVATYDAAVGGAPDIDDLSIMDRSLRGAAILGGDTIFLAGEEEENVWYQRLDRDGGGWDPAWLGGPAGYAPVNFFQPAITQAIATGDGRVFAGGTYDVAADQPSFYLAWLRGLTPTNGAVECECETMDAGILALAVGEGGEVYLGGFKDTGTETMTWYGRIEDGSCASVCEFAWQDGTTGSADNDEFYRPEFIQDAIYAAVVVPGGVVFGGAVDRKPVAARFGADGSGPLWALDTHAEVTNATVLAMHVSADGSCLTLAGSSEYSNIATRKWWFHRESID